MIRSRPLIAPFAIVLLLAAACGGSSAQREALEDDPSSSNVEAADPSAIEAPVETETPADTEAPATPDAPDPVASPDPGSAPAPTPAATPAPKPAPRSAKAGSNTAGANKAGAKAAAPAPKPAKGASGGASAPAPAPAPAPDAPAPGQAAAPAPAPGGGGGATDVGVTADSIKVGHIGIYSGPVGSFGDDLSHACRAGLQAINDEGGVVGRKLDVKVRDDAWDATKGANAVRDLVEREKVFGLACSQSVPTNDAVTPYLDQQKVPNVGSDGWGEAQYEGEWSFPVGASAVNQAENLAEYQVREQGAKRVGVIFLNNTTGESYAKAYEKVLEEAGGEMVVSQVANFDDPGTTTFIAQARANNVDTITSMVDPGIFARMVREAAAQGYKPKNGYSGNAALYFEATPGLAGPPSEGTIAAIDWTPDDPKGPAGDSPGYRAYADTVERYYPNIDHSNWTKAAYVGYRVFHDSLKRLGANLTRQGMKDDLNRVTNFETGLGPKITFRPGDHRSNTTTYLAQLQKEGNELVWRYIAGPIVNTRRDKG
ncbi:MAG: ABC transporter substrate-binding protein [Acidimicrobiia bacterium]